MGKQTNAFQRLCAYLQEQFHAPAKVEESAFLPDKHTGQPREIDVLVTTPINDSTLTLGFECRDRKAVDDVTFVELTSAKHEATGVNLSVLYSTSGFSAPARKKAHAFGMRLVQAEEGLQEDWPTWLRTLKTAYWAEFLISPSDVTVETTEGVRATPPANLPLVDANGQPLGPDLDLKSVVHSFIQQQMPNFLKDAAPGTNGAGEFRIDLSTPIMVADNSGKIHCVLRLTGRLTWEAPTRIAINLRHKRVEGVPVVFGEGTVGDRKAEFHWISGPTGSRTIATRQIGKEPAQRAELYRVDAGEKDGGEWGSEPEIKH